MGVVMTWFLFWNILFDCDWSFPFSFFASDVFCLFSVVCFSHFDWLTNSGPYFAFNPAYSDNMLITYSSSRFSFDVAPATGFLLQKLVNFRLPPVELQYQRVLDDLTILLVLHYFDGYSGFVLLAVPMLNGLCTIVLSSR